MGYSRARKTNPACETARFSSSTKRSLKLKVKDRSGGYGQNGFRKCLEGRSDRISQGKREKTYRSGYYLRGVNTQYGQISDLAVPKLREGNKEREWQILERYQRSLGNLLDWMCVLYVIGLSLRDLQEALYLILGKVLSVSAVNQITLNVQKQIESRRQVPLTRIPKMILVDGVWVEIQYTMDGEFKVQSFIMAVATLFATSQGLAVVDGGHRRWVDTHWFRGNSYFRIGCDWIKAAVLNAWNLIHQVRFSSNFDSEPSMASRPQHRQRLHRLEFTIHSYQYFSA
jgi:hypothetical protein